MAITTFPQIAQVSSLIDLQIHQLARKCFHYHAIGKFPYNLLIVVLSINKGAADYFYNCISGKATTLRTGHAYILPCHVPVRYERTPGVTVVTMRFNLTYYYGLDVFHGCTEIEEIPSPDLIDFLKTEVCSKAEADTQIMKNALMLKTLVSHLCLARWPERLNEMSVRLAKYEEGFRYVRQAGDASLNVAGFAQCCGMRQDVFSRSFKRDTGQSPKQYISDYLVRKISALLLTTDMTLKEIAHELNFNSEYYLSRFFKAQTRLSPRKFKAQYRTPSASL